MTIEELEIKQNELRKLRDEYTDKSRECQKEIDLLELEKYETPKKLLGKIIKITYDNDVTYLLVNKIERLYSGPRCSGPSITIFYKDENNIEYPTELNCIKVENISVPTYNFYSLSYNDEYNCSWKEIQNIQILENSEEIKEIMKQITIDVNNIFC